MPTEQQKQQFESVQQIRAVLERELPARIESLVKQFALEGDVDRQFVNVERVKEIFRELAPTLLARSITTIEGNLELKNSANMIVGTTTGSKIASSSSQKLGFWGTSPVVQPASLTAQSTSITHTAPVTDDFAIANLTQTSPYGFVSQDEGNTVLKVLLNLQTRLAEVEARLESSGLIASN